MSNFLVIYSCCILVKGINRSTIIDTQRNEIYYIPNHLYDILNENNFIDIDSFFSKNENKLIISEYFDFLLENDLAFITDIPQNFPKINLDWDYPGEISNAVIDYNDSNYNFKNIFNQLSLLGCENILIRFFSNIDLLFLIQIIEKLDDTKIKCLDIVITNSKLKNEDYTHLVNKYKRIRSILLANSNNHEFVVLKTKEDMGNIFAINNNIEENNISNNFKIDLSRMNLNLKFIAESINYNNFLNRKVSIDSKGNIKNYPSFEKSYGNVNKVKIKDAILNIDFKKHWKITKDNMPICKDCEYRYCCLSFSNVEKNILRTDEFCKYNPYNNIWEA